MRRLIAVSGLASAVLLGATLGTLALLAPTGGKAPAPVAGLSAALDGRDFDGVLRPVDGAAPVEDTLHFRDGHFWSESCVDCAFRPGEYWTRRTADGALEFTGTLGSPERGTFDYEGRVEGDRIEVRIAWRRARWYGDATMDLVFEGRAFEPGTGAVSLESAWARAQGRPPPHCRL